MSSWYICLKPVIIIPTSVSLAPCTPTARLVVVISHHALKDTISLQGVAQGQYVPPDTSPNLRLHPRLPPTYYCGAGSFAPTQCWVGTYCPAKSNAAYNCPAGYIGINASGLAHLSDVTTACEACEAGKYGNDPNRLLCYPGEPGWIYYGATTTQYPVNVTSDNGEPCPAGYYCGANSTSGTACAAGTYQPDESATSIEACVNCPANFILH